MIANFDKETAPLTDAELNMVGVIANNITKYDSPKNTVTGKQICEGINRARATGWPTLTGPRLRKIINHIRRTHRVVGLCATSNGYYVEANPMEIRNFAANSLRARANAILEIAEALEKQAHHLEHKTNGQQLKIS